jgi:hypothetical protein
MIGFLILFLHVLVSPFKTRAQLEAEIVLLRHQLGVLRQRVPSRPKLTLADRLLFVWLYRLFPSVLEAVTIVQPETVIRWHRKGFRLYWRWKSRSRGGRPDGSASSPLGPSWAGFTINIAGCSFRQAQAVFPCSSWVELTPRH